MKTINLRAALLVLVFALLLLAPSIASAAERIHWVGTTTDDNRLSYTKGGDGTWTYRTSRLPDYEPTLAEVRRTRDYIELTDDDSIHVRIYADKLMSWSPRSERWYERAEGEWK